MNSADAESGDRLPLIRHLLFDCQKHQSEACLPAVSLIASFWLFRVCGHDAPTPPLELALFMPFRGKLPRKRVVHFRVDAGGAADVVRPAERQADSGSLAL